MLENIKQAKNWEDRYRFIIQAGKHLPQPLQMNWLKCNQFKAAKRDFGL